MTAPRKGYRTCTKCGRNRALRFYKEKGRVCAPCQKTRVSAASRDVRLMETYGITLEQYDEILRRQGGGCAICGGKRRGNLDVDHCHRTLVVRGLLCRRCNRRLLPAAQDRIDRLEAAIEYLVSSAAALSPAAEVLGDDHRTPK